MELAKRKHPRLKGYDYSTPGFYYVTICLEDKTVSLSTVGRGLAPAAAEVRLTEIGQIIHDELLELETRFRNVKIDRSVIMPDHLHLIVQISEESAGASPRPTLMDVIGVFKSLATRKCNVLQNQPGRKLFQSSFYDTVLRNEFAYLECCRYIDENPLKLLLGYHR